MKQFVEFKKIMDETVPKGFRYLIMNEGNDDCFGQIYFYDNWSKWIVELNHLVIFDQVCLNKISEFMRNLN